MAGDWIKFETATPDKPEVWLIAGALNIDPDAVVGKLLRVWGWFDQHTENGVAPIQTKAMLDRLSGVPGFCEAVAKAGWLKIDGSNLILPGFEKHSGKTAKQRINTARRVANHKARKDGTNDGGNAELTQQVTGERACIPRPVRAAVYQRDSHTCVYCGRAEGEYSAGETSRDGLLSADHVIPVVRGGANIPENLVTCCLPCNLFKGDRTPDEAGLKWPCDGNGERYGCVSSSVSEALPKEEKRRSNTPISPLAKKSAIEIKTYIEQCGESGEDPIPITDPVFKNAEKLNLPPEFLAICWRRFVEKNSESKKKYIDWRAAFRNAVNDNWYKLWWVADDGSYQLTTAGKQAQKLQESQS